MNLGQINIEHLNDPNVMALCYLRAVVVGFFRGVKQADVPGQTEDKYYPHAQVEHQFSAACGVTIDQWTLVINAVVGLHGLDGYYGTLHLRPTTVTRGE